jgi:hypothetical protein
MSARRALTLVDQAPVSDVVRMKAADSLSAAFSLPSRGRRDAVDSPLLKSG